MCNASGEVHQTHEEEHEAGGRDDDEATESVDDPLDPHVWRDVFAVDRVVAAGVQVRVRRGGIHAAIGVQRQVAARVHFTAREWDARQLSVVGNRKRVRAVPVLCAPIVPVRIRVTDAATCVSIDVSVLYMNMYPYMHD